MQYLIVLIVVAVVIYAISGPLRAQRSAGRAGPDPVAELEAARDAKYREIRDAELDVRTGKLSDEDYRRSTPRCAPRRSKSSTSSIRPGLVTS